MRLLDRAARGIDGKFPNQPLTDLLHGADFSGLVSVGVAAGAYWALRKASV